MKTAASRLAALRRIARPPNTWRDHRGVGPLAAAPRATFDGPRMVGYCDEIVSMPHRGWPLDGQRSEVVRGVVLQWPARRGVPRYFPAIECSETDEIELHPAVMFDTSEAAARAADSYAKEHVEIRRFYRINEDARLKVDGLKLFIQQLRFERRRIRIDIRTLRKNGNMPKQVIQIYLSRLTENLESSRSANEKIGRTHLALG